jgi:hypothetical protein
MKTIELTDEQAEELKGLLIAEIDTADEELRGQIASLENDDPDLISYRHYRDTVADILHILEIA